MADDWRVLPLGDIAELAIGRTPSRSEPRYWTSDLTHPFCSIADIKGGMTVSPTKEGVTQDAIAEGKAKRVPAGALLMTFKLSIGRTGISARDLYPNEAIVWIEPNPKDALRDYLRLYLPTHNFDAAVGVAVKGKTLNKASLASLMIPLPPIEQQRRIADLGDTLDLTLAATARQLASARQLAATQRSSVFANEEKIRLADLVDVTMGRQRAPKHQVGDHIVPYLRAGNVKNGYLKLDDVLEMNFTPTEQAKYALRPGDVLVTEGCGSLSQIGASASWSGEVAGTVCFQNTLLRLRARPTTSDPEFVYQWARWAFESGLFAETASGTNIFHIGAERAVDMPFPKLPRAEQAAISQRLSQMDVIADALSEKLDASIVMRDSIVRALVDGSVELNEDYDHFLAAADAKQAGEPVLVTA